MRRINAVNWRPDIQSDFEVLSLSGLRSKNRYLPHSIFEPQRLDFHLLVFYWAGIGSHMVDFQEFKCKRGTLIHVSPNQVHAFGSEQDNEAYLLVFRSEMLPRDFFGSITNETIPAEYVWPSAFHLDEPTLLYCRSALDYLIDHLESPGNWMHPESARHISIGLASLSFHRAIHEAPVLKTPKPNRVFLDFLSLVEDSFDCRRDVKWYAARLNCSYKNLCRICKDASGSTPKMIIDRRVIREARRLLIFTDTSASEIGSQLGFAEPTNFGKFFQRLEGTSPDAFRRMWKS